MLPPVDLSKQEEFIDNLKLNIDKDMENRNKMNEQIEKLYFTKIKNLIYYLKIKSSPFRVKLQNFIQNLIEKDMKNFKMEYEVGCSVYYEAEM
jgi:hypothetical protein